MTFDIVNVTPDTPAWWEERRRSLGASEVPAVLGLSPYGTPITVYRSKLGIGDDTMDPERAYVGHASEDLIAGWLQRFRPDLGDVGPAVMVRNRATPWLHASLDRTLTRDGVTVPVQMKSAHYYGVKDWEDGTPVLVEAQIQAELHSFDAPYGFAAVFGGDMRVRLFRVERNDEWIRGYLIPETHRYWTGHVEARVEPDPITLAEVATRYPTDPDTTVDAGDEVAAKWAERETLRATKSDAEARMKALDLDIARHMGAAETLTHGGRPLATYKTQAGRRTVSVADAEVHAPHLIRQGDPFKVFRPATTRKKKTDVR